MFWALFGMHCSFYRCAFIGTNTQPYLGLYLTDLTFAEDKLPSRVGGRINLVKCQAIAAILAELARFARRRFVRVLPFPLVFGAHSAKGTR